MTNNFFSAIYLPLLNFMRPNYQTHTSLEATRKFDPNLDVELMPAGVNVGIKFTQEQLENILWEEISETGTGVKRSAVEIQHLDCGAGIREISPEELLKTFRQYNEQEFKGSEVYSFRTIDTMSNVVKAKGIKVVVGKSNGITSRTFYIPTKSDLSKYRN